jgi:hypothetical protein
MGSWNGVIASSTQNILSGSGAESGPVSAEIPAKLFSSAVFGARVTGFTTGSGGHFGVVLVGAIGGATFVIAGVTAITANGNYLMGTTADATSLIPRPSTFLVQGFSGGATIAIGMAGEY